MRITIDYTPTPHDLADAFCELTARQMAEFFARCKELSCTWGSGGIVMQASWLADAMPPGTPGAQFLTTLAAPLFEVAP